MTPCSILPFLRQAVVAAMLLVGLSGGGLGSEPAAPSLPRVPPGTAAVAPAAARFNRVVYLAVSRISTGDADAVPTLIRDRVPLFTLALLATVSQAADEQGQPAYRLAEVGAGYAVPLAGRLTVIDPDSPPAEAGIDFVGRQVLAANGRHLAELRRVGVNRTMQVVDVDSLFQRNGGHTPLVMRHYIWTEARSGRCACCVWLLARQSDGTLKLAADPPRWLQEGTRDTRGIHVDADAFFLGMPTRDAFALTELPPGADLAWSDDLRQVAAINRYAEADLRLLAAAINQSLEPLR